MLGLGRVYMLKPKTQLSMEEAALPHHTWPFVGQVLLQQEMVSPWELLVGFSFLWICPATFSTQATMKS